MPAFGKYYNNGVINKRIQEGEPIPEGFVPGMKPRSREYQDSINAKRRKTNLERYGVEHVLQSSEVQKDMRQRSLEKYGTEHPMQNKEVREHVQQMFFDKHGVYHPSQLEEVQQKRKQTNLERYGVEHAAQSDIIKEKTKQHFIEKYGVENPFQSEEVQEKIKQTMLDTYGVEKPLQSEVFKEKARQSWIEKYGVDNPLKCSEIQEKVINTNLEKYGTACVFQSEEIKEKTKQTSLEKYGTEYPNQSEEVKAKMIETSLKHWGTTNPMQSEEIQHKLKDSVLEKYGVDSYSKTSEYREKVQQTNLERYGVRWACLRPEVRIGHNNDSKPNREFAEILDKLNVEYTREFPLEYYSYDFKVGKYLIEINPSATHNTLWSPFNKEHGVSRSYHWKKSHMAKKHGYHCIHVFDWDDREKIALYLSRKEIVLQSYDVSIVSKEESDRFLNKYNFYGTHSNNTKECVNIGLYNNNELISIMSFTKSRGNRFDYVLSRYCSMVNTREGHKILFDFFKNQYQISSLLTICDNSKFDTWTAENLGFKKVRNSKICCNWYNLGNNRRLTGWSPQEILLIQEGYLPIYDCGYTYLTWNR